MAIDGEGGPVTGGGGEGGDGAGGGGGGGGEPAVQADPGTPVHEERLWETRAEKAELRVQELEHEVETLRAQLEEARKGADASERRRETERLLREANAVDVETASLLTEMAVSAMESPDVASAVAELRRTKPYLFRASAPHASAMSASVPDDGVQTLETLADEARTSGDRSALLRYLRGRRGA